MDNKKINTEVRNSLLPQNAAVSFFSLWYIRTFKVISNQRAKELGLKWYRNVFGDEINHINCRSIWTDKQGRIYRVSHLENISD